MIKNIFILITVFFLIGGLGVWRICIKKPAERKRLLLKYFMYIFIVYGTCFYFSFCFQNSFPWLGILLCIIGTGEIIYAWIRSPKKSISLLIFGIIYFFMISYAFLLSLAFKTGLFHLELYTVVLSFDGFSQISGQLFGRKKITPKISPNKTLAGVIGGALIAIVTGFFIFVSEEPNSGRRIFFSVMIVTGAFAGDLLASLYKRRCEVKDYSNLLPGHGGILDRFDSFIFAETIAFVLLLFGK